MSNFVNGLAFRTPKFCIPSYGKINHRLLNLSYDCDVKLDLSIDKPTGCENR